MRKSILVIIFLSYYTSIHASFASPNLSITKFLKSFLKSDNCDDVGTQHDPLMIMQYERQDEDEEDEDSSVSLFDFYLPEYVVVKPIKESPASSTTGVDRRSIPYYEILISSQTDTFTLKFRQKRYETELYLCPPENSKDEELVGKIAEYFWGAKHCLLEKSFRTNQPKICEREVQPVLVPKIGEIGIKKCGPYRKLDLLLFVYPYCYKSATLETLLKKIQEENVEKYTTEPFPLDHPLMTMYEICFDENREETFYTHHYIFPSLLKNEKYLIKATNKYEDDSEVEHDQELPRSTQDYTNIDSKQPKEEPQDEHVYLKDKSPQFYHEQNKFLKMKEAFKNQSDEPRMAEQFLVPAEDMPFPLWKKTTFSYFNIAALWEPLVPMMDLINDRIRQLAKAIQNNRKLSIYTTATTFTFEDKKTFHINNNENFRVPNFWNKIVHDEERKLATAIMIRNTPDSDLDVDKLCEENDRVICNFVNWLETSTLTHIKKEQIEFAIKYTYCCTVTPDLQKIYGIKGVEGVINDLSYPLENDENANIGT